MSDEKIKKYESSLISASSILILSGFLIGFTTAHLTGERVSPLLLACGLMGCLAFVICDVGGRRRLLSALRREQRQMERRLDKHLNPLHHPESMAAAHLARLGLTDDAGEAGAF